MILVEKDYNMSAESNNIKYDLEEELDRAAPTDPYEADPEIEEIDNYKLEQLIEEAKNFQSSFEEFKKTPFF